MSDDPTRERLLHAAGAIFADKGFKAATVREICDRAGANIAAVNYHFRDKERLYVEAVKHAHRCGAGSVPFPVWGAGVTPERRLRDFIHTMARRMLASDIPAWQTQIIMRELAHPTAACLELVQEYIRPMADVLRAILRDMTAPVPPETELYQLGFSIMGQLIFYRQCRPIIAHLLGEAKFAALTAEAIAEHVTRFSLAALESWSMGKCRRGGPPARRRRRRVQQGA
jgi:AcrR family transcriptional regulator